MNNTVYIISNKYYAGLKLFGVGITSAIDSKEEKVISIDNVIKLALNGKISNAEAVYDSYNDVYHLSIKDRSVKIKSIFEKKRGSIIIKSRTVNELGNTISYTVLDSEYKLHKVDLKTLWELALYGEVGGVKATLVGGVKALMGEEVTCKNIIKYSENMKGEE